MLNAKYTFKPKSMPGAKEPPFRGETCKGHDLSKFGMLILRGYGKLYLYWLTGAFKDSPDKGKFFNSYFNRLAGNSTLKKQIIDKIDEDDIAASWKPDLDKFKKIRKGYLLYPDFE